MAPRRRTLDPPDGVLYRWVAPFDRSYGPGWTPVPPQRHPRMPRLGRRIFFGGMVLMERWADREMSEQQKQ